MVTRAEKVQLFFLKTCFFIISKSNKYALPFTSLPVEGGGFRNQVAGAEETERREQEIASEADTKTDCQRQKAAFAKSRNVLLCAIQESASKTETSSAKQNFELIRRILYVFG